MATNILSIGKSALNAAQVGLSTTGHNIANAATPGYNRQVVIQGSANAQNFGFGFIGQGTQVVAIERVYNEFLNNQVVSSQSAKTALDTYYAQISGIDNVLADPSAGLSPALQGFFKGIQDLTANPNAAASRQAVLSGAQTLAARFQSLSSQLAESRTNVNSQIASSVTSINAYAQQIAQLNGAIEKAASTGSAPNDLMDQRDQLVADLNREVKASVVKDGDSYGITIGNGQPLVLGTQTFGLTAVASADDASRLQVGYAINGHVSVLPEQSLGGGKLAGLFDYRSQTLDVAQNALGRVALGLASDFNAQHALGLDQNGAAGQAFFQVGTPLVLTNSKNDKTAAATVSAQITDSKALTTSDYRMQFDGAAYKVTRLSDGTSFSDLSQPIDGIMFSAGSGTPVAGDSFLIKPTATGAEQFKVLVTDTTKIAAAGVPAIPVLASIGSGNTGAGAIQVSGVDAGYAGAPLPAGTTLGFKYDLASNSFAVTPPSAVTVTVGGIATTYAAGDPVPYTDGATMNSHGINFQVSGAPADTDSFILRPSNNIGDNSNALALGALQTANTQIGGTASYQGAYSQLVSLIGNKTHELDVNRTAEGNQLLAAQQAQQSESGVNLDEEAANIMRYQQAYQAAAKVMQTASTMFDTLLSLGH
jgi:flagellar hook-associated protein 1